MSLSASMDVVRSILDANVDKRGSTAVPVPLAVLRQIMRALQWQPIETAPKGLDAFGLAQNVLLASYGGREPHVCEGYFRHEVNHARVTRVKAGWVSCMDPNAPDPYLEPHFWQPLPAPPNNTGEGDS